MKILLVRHGAAVPESAGVPDAMRYLTADGRAHASALGSALAREGLAIDRIVSSPLARALQTAELVAAAAAPGCAVEVAASLAPGARSEHALAEARARGTCVVLVGHEPHLSGVGSLASGIDSFPALRRTAACLLDGDRPLWTLLYSDAAPAPWAPSR